MLFTIPSDLRNTCYEYALISSKRINIKLHTKQPALLRTCRQLREEATVLYYTCNAFRHVIHDYDGGVSGLLQTVRGYNKDHSSKNALIQLCSDSSCGKCSRAVDLGNLMHRLHEYNDDKHCVPSVAQDTSIEHSRGRTMARRMFGVVEAIRHKPWDWEDFNFGK